MKALIVTGEASGDLYGGRLAVELMKRLPGLQIAGMGGPHLQESGASLLYHYDRVAVVGVFEVFSKLKSLRTAFNNIREWISKERPDFAVLIDFPDFNFRVARILKKEGIKIFYFISPQIWAWRKSRIHFLRDHIDLMICVLPFEKDLYSGVGIPVEYIGHPLVEIVRSEVQNQPAYIKGENPLIGIMPGSREVEMRRHLPVLLETVRLIRMSHKADVVLVWPPSLPETHEIPQDVVCVKENRYAAMKACDLMLVASGTSTLECAILGVPEMIVYRVSSISWQMGKILVRVPYYGLVNWIAGELAVPEYIQNRMSPELLAKDALQILNSSEELIDMKKRLARIVEKLGPPGSINRAVEAIIQRI
jgi:lipid-A-disaccharide synthase